MADRVSIGAQTGVHFALEWTGAGGSAAEITRGRLVLAVGDSVVWGQGIRPEEATGFEWTWVELVEHLASAWRWLQWEEADPLHIDVRPDLLRAQAERAWQAMPAFRREEQEQALWGFEHAHNLAEALRGAWLPAVWLLREGLDCRISWNGVDHQQACDEVLGVLGQLGDAICARIELAGDARAQAALREWRGRSQIETAEVARIATGLPEEVLAQLAGGADLATAFELEAGESSELLVAARMVGRALPPADTARILKTIRQTTRRPTPVLDGLAAEAKQGPHAMPRSARPCDAGYAIAQWLRERLGLGERDRVDPEQLLREWNVLVDDTDMPSGEIDALASWGPRHGPVVLVNRRGRHARSPAGRRATLAHEVGHMLADRERALPLAEAKGGPVPVHLEARANAFAAELLLPRQQAGEAVAGAAEPLTALRRLGRTFGVSSELAAWQARNSGVPMNDQAHARLRGLVTRPDYF